MASSQNMSSLSTSLSASQLQELSSKARQERQDAKSSSKLQTLKDFSSYLVGIVRQLQQNGEIEKRAATGAPFIEIAYFYPPNYREHAEGCQNTKGCDCPRKPSKETHFPPGVEDGLPIYMLVFGLLDMKTKTSDPRKLPGGRSVLDIAKDSLPEGFFLTTTRDARHRNSIRLVWDYEEYERRGREAAAKYAEQRRGRSAYTAPPEKKTITLDEWQVVRTRKRPTEPSVQKDEPAPAPVVAQSAPSEAAFDELAALTGSQSERRKLKKKVGN
jgi:hypothetical protein